MQMDMFGATAVAQPQRFVGFCDGSALGNGQADAPGGWGFVLQDDKGAFIAESHGSAAGTTNNKMELQSAIELLKRVPEGSTISVTTDSKYVIDGLTSWIKGWKAKGWKTAKGDPVKNKELWLELDALNSKRKATFDWVRGHSGHPGNERADELAKLGAYEARDAA